MIQHYTLPKSVYKDVSFQSGFVKLKGMNEIIACGVSALV